MVNKRIKKGHWKIFFLFFIIFLLSFVILKAANYWADVPFEARVIDNENISIDNTIVKISFSQPVAVWDEEDLVIYPDADFDAILADDYKSISINFKEKLLDETKYSILLSGIISAGGMQIYEEELFFYTEVSSLKELAFSDVTLDFGEFNFSEDKYFPPESSRVSEDYSVVPYITEGKYIDVNITEQVMTLFEDGVVVNEFLISSGKYGMATPLGSYKVKSKEENHWSFSYGLWMPYSMNFYGPYYIHELPYWPSGYREGEDHLGYRVSHGCIRLGIGPAEHVFNWSEIGTEIYIHT